MMDFFNLQVPDLFTTEEIGTSSWMTDSDVAKLRMNYQCDGRKLILIQSL